MSTALQIVLTAEQLRELAGMVADELAVRQRGSGQALRVADAAARLGVSRATVTRLISSGQLRTTRLGRARLVPQNEIDRLLANSAVGERSDLDSDDAEIARAVLNRARRGGSR